MATLLSAAAAAQQRRPVVVYSPGRRVQAAQTRAPARSARVAPRRRINDEVGAGSWAAWSERVSSTPAAQRKRQEEMQPEEEGGGFWGSDFGKGIGYIVNNPITRAVTMPLNYLQTGGRLTTLGLEELAENVPILGDIADVIVDTKRTEADKRSNWEKVFSPDTTYGFGEIAQKTGNKWLDRAVGLAGDIALDPLTYLTAGGTRLVAGLGHIDEAADALRLAGQGLEAAEAAGDATQIKRATDALRRAEEYVAKAPEMPARPPIRQQMPRTRAERVEFISRLEGTEEGRRILSEFPGEIQRAGARGFHTATPALKEALNIQPPGLRVRGLGKNIPLAGARVPLSGPIGQGIATAGGAVRTAAGRGIDRLPGRLPGLRVPAGLEDAFAVLSREAEGDVLLAASDVAARNRIRLGTGAQRARGGRRIVNMVRKGFKGKSDEAIQQLRREAETSPTPNIINEIASGILETYASVTGRTINRQYLRNPDTYFPHLLDPKWRRTLAAASKRGDKGALDFIEATGLKQEELLEEGAFYVDNLLEGSGFLEKSRKLGLDKDGNPQTIKIGGKEISFEADDLDHINEKLHEAFPTWKGDFYDTDPTRVLEAYNSSLARQAGRDLAKQQGAAAGNPLYRAVDADLVNTQRAINEAAAQQGAAPLLSTAQGRYDPTMPLPDVPERPVVPGSREDRARRAAVLESVDELAAARTPEEAMAASKLLEAAPAPAPRFGDVDPNEFFSMTAGRKATEERDAAVKRAATYARAAAAEANETEAAIRKGLTEVREELVTPLRTSVRETKEQISKVNTKIRKWQKQVPELGPLTTNNADELTVLQSKVDEQISNIESKIRQTRGRFRGRATRAQRKAEQELRVSLDKLRKVRDDIQKNVREAPARMQDEYNTRLEALNRPVTEAKARLDTAEDAFIAKRPAPHSQAEIDAAQALVDRNKGVPPNDILDAQKEKYRAALQEITDINTRRTPKGTLTRADRQRMNQLVREAKDLETTLQRAVNQQQVVSPYEQAQARLDELTAKLPDTPRKELPALQRQIDELTAEFSPGGKHAAERRARRIIRRTDEWDTELANATKTERAVWERAQAERLTRQEAIIWADRGKVNRHITRPGQPPSQLEQIGWRAGEGRFPEPITGGEGFPEGQRIPQPEAWSQTERPAITDVVGGQVSERGETVVAPGEVNRPRPVPTPRTEVEALESLQGQLQYGSPAQQATRIPLKQAEQNLIDATTRAPHEIAAERVQIAEVYGKMADEAVGGDVTKAETFTNLAKDLTDKAQLVAKRDEATALRDRLNAVSPKYRKHDLGNTIDEIESVARANPDLADDQLTKVESVLQSHRQDLERIERTRMRVSDLDRITADAERGRLGKVMVATTHDNWRLGHNGPMAEGDILVAAELHKRINNLFELSRQPRALGRTWNAFTNLFKTYATLSPGFFVRNALGGIFMNTADGVALGAQGEGAKLWQKFISPDTDPNWLDTQPRRVQEAFAAAFASGAGGRFEDTGILHRTNSRAYNMLSSNPPTRLGQRLGTRVEGAMRLGMALDSFDKGMDIAESLGRISRVHFDYAQVSDLDESMKRIIPFWTFMSRNLPLQIQEQWTNPRVYSYYDHLISNFSEPDEEFTPDYWKRQGAWRTPISIGGNPLYLQPDLGFTRVQSDIQMLGDALSGENAGALASQTNPLAGATLDFLQKRDSFYNRAYTDKDYKEMNGPLGSLLTMIAKPLGRTNEAGQVDENFINYLSSLIPPLNQAMRLLPEASGAETTADTWAKRARYMGVPTQLLTPAAEESEYWRQWREMQDESARQRAMLREASR